MLFKTTAEIRDSVNIATQSQFANLSPDLQRAEDQVIKKYLGDAQYEALLTNYNAHGQDITLMDADLAALIVKCRPVIAGIGLYKYSALHGVSISDSGYQMISTDTHKQAFQWMKNEARAYLVQVGYTALDDLLRFLEEEKATYTLWADSSAYTLNKSFIVNDAVTFSTICSIGQSRLTYLAMAPLMKKVEDFVIRGALGATVYNDLKATIADPTATQTYESILPDLQAAVVFHTMARALFELPLEVYESGILINYSKVFVKSDNVTSYTGASETDRKKLSEQFISDGNTYLALAIEYLNANASSTVFPLWYASSKYVAPGTGSGEIRKATDKIMGFF